MKHDSGAKLAVRAEFLDEDIPHVETFAIPKPITSATMFVAFAAAYPILNWLNVARSFIVAS